MAEKVQIIDGVILKHDGSSWTTGPWRFIFDEHDLVYVLRGPDRAPEGFTSLTAGVKALVAEGRVEAHEGFVPRAEVEVLLQEFERGIRHLIVLEVKSVGGFEQAARIAESRLGELLRRHALRARYDAYGTSN